MNNFLNWLSEHKFQAHLTAFLLIALPSILLYFAAQQNTPGWTWALLGLIALGNLLAICVR